MIIITGGAGFIGSNLIARLNKENIGEIIVVDNLAKTSKWKNLVGKEFLDFIHKNQFIDMLFQNRIKPIDAIIHLGACSSTTEKDADYLLENNYHYSRRLAEWTIDNGSTFIYASSAATYGDGSFGYSDNDENTLRLKPLNMYGYSKQLMDEFVLKNGFQEIVTGLKFFNVYGPNEYHKGDMKSIVCKAYHQIKQTGKVKLFKSNSKKYSDGEQKRDFIYVKDAVNIILWFLVNNKINGIYNVGSGKAKSWNELAKAVFKAMDKKPEIEYFDMPASLNEKYQNYTKAVMKKLKDTGYRKEFYSLEKGIEDYVRNYLMENNKYN